MPSASASGQVRVQVRRGLLDQLIGEQLLENYLNENGYRISDEQLMRILQQTPEFQVDGSFDMATYRSFLAERGMEPTRYEQLQRNSLRQRQLQLAVAATALVTPAEYRRYLNLFAEQRVVRIASINEDVVADNITVTEEMIVTFYGDKPSLYRRPDAAGSGVRPNSGSGASWPS